MLRWMKTLKRRIETSGFGGRPITGVDLQPVKYGIWFLRYSVLRYLVIRKKTRSDVRNKTTIIIKSLRASSWLVHKEILKPGKWT